MYEDINDFLARVEDADEKTMNSRRLLSQEQIDDLRKVHPRIPEEFLSYLQEVGAGAFRECQFTVYGFLDTPDNILGKDVLLLKEPSVRALCFGDNFSGDLGAFLPDEDWVIADLWHDNGTICRKGRTFRQYIREKMFISEDGRDLQEG